MDSAAKTSKCQAEQAEGQKTKEQSHSDQDTEEVATMPIVFSLLTVWLLQLTLIQVCGEPKISPKIIGGQPASPGSWPWQVLVVCVERYYCGGSLIAEQWVLTAAHCVKCNNTSDYKVLLGAYQLSKPSDSEIRSDVEQIEIHPDYYPFISADIALVKLKAPVEFTDYIHPISLLHSLEEVPMDADCWVTGWGDIKYNVSLPDPQTLQELKVPLINRSACNDLFNSDDDNPMDPVKPGMLCAGYAEGGKNAAEGDSGGPLVCKREGGWTQVGVVSFVIRSTEPKGPGVYTSVSAYFKWIQATTGALQTAP
ncbi:serine protease 27-like [Elgaria multicarinata webbii]|uniref:serine protease 27-like n=1 Tax=Elgaria multicarinata webbii TaxID=159646 RepID=UPI002FCD0F55